MALLLKDLQKGRKSVLDRYKKDEDLVPLFLSETEGCTDLLKKVKEGKKLGEGVSASAFQITLGGQQYVLRIEVAPKTHYAFPKKYTDEQIEVELEDMGYEISDIMNSNREIIKDFVLFDLKEEDPFTLCKIHAPFSSLTPLKLKYPKGSYICRYPALSGYIIQLLCSELYSSGKCIYFLDTYGMNVCDTKIPYQKVQITVMQKASVSLDRLIKENLLRYGLPDPITAINSIYIQVLFAIAAMQGIYGISHNDLHNNNVLLEFIKPDVTTYNGQTFKITDSRISCQHIRMNGKDYYLPPCWWIVKIIDFGISAKFASPVVMSTDIATDRYKVVPNWWCPAYDSLYFTKNYTDIPYSTIAKCVLQSVIKPKDLKKSSKLFDKNDRPNFKLLQEKYSHVTAQYILESLLHPKFSKPVKGEKYVLTADFQTILESPIPDSVKYP